MFSSTTARMLRRAVAKQSGAMQMKSASSRAMSSHSFDISGSFETHNFETAPSETAEVTKDELVDLFELMYTMRRMEITCDTEYKARNIRGLCHLYDGQEAVATGIQTALDKEDSWVTSYRCHVLSLMRGGSVSKVIGELFGKANGVTKGKGGSMHMYSKEHNFFGGHGIVGAQVPVGTGLAFAAKYNAKVGEPSQCAIACYGDGAANQGQIWEAANMANLWDLPMIFCIENNHYGMGTSIDRHSSISDYYKMGNTIPGLRIDGMNVLAVTEGMKFAKDYVCNGNGPMYVEMMTYRYHGHSMSDPGTTYRNRDEIEFTRTNRDPIEHVKTCLKEAGFMTAEEIKDTEKRIRKEVQKEVMKAKAWEDPALDAVVDDIYAKSLVSGDSTYPSFIRMPDMAKSFEFKDV